MGNCELAHYGILGMKWGVRRTPEQLGATQSQISSVSEIVNNTKNINATINNMRTRVDTKELSAMSDQEIMAKINRMNLEQQFINTSNKQIAKGHDYVMDTLNIAGNALAVAGSVVAIMLSVAQLKKMGEGS